VPVPGAAVLFPGELTFMAGTEPLRCRSELATEPEKVGKEADPRTLVPFSGQKFSAGSSGDCGHYLYDARSN
jgi:hypothetical protein